MLTTEASEACVSPSGEGREDYRASVCSTMRLLLRESLASSASSSPPRRHSRLCTFPGHILEHSEDDTKSLFIIIKVREAFPLAGAEEAALSDLALLRAQIISDLLFFRGTHRKDFDSRWKSFTLVKKSMENRVSARTCVQAHGGGLTLSTCPTASREEAAHPSAPHRPRAAAARGTSRHRRRPLPPPTLGLTEWVWILCR